MVIATQSGALMQVDLAKLIVKPIVLTGSTLCARLGDAKAGLILAVQAMAWPWVASGAVDPRGRGDLPVGTGIGRPIPARGRLPFRQDRADELAATVGPD